MKIIKNILSACLAVGVLAFTYGAYVQWIGVDFENNPDSDVNIVMFWGGMGVTFFSVAGVFFSVYFKI